MMDSILQQLADMEWWKQVLIGLDAILFFLYMLAVLYLCMFALFSGDKRRNTYPKAKKQHRFAILFSAYKADQVIIETVSSFLKQDYNKSNYDIIIVSDQMQPQTNELLAQMPITLLSADYPDNTKTKALQYAISTLDASSYDAVAVMDADNTTDTDFLSKVNDAYYSGGMAIQTHRVAKERETDTAVLDAVSEEINNSIFRQGHVRLGFSSALIGSGMVFNFNWFKENICKATHIGIEKQLETMLLEQRIFIEYLNDVFVYDDKTCRASSFYSQRHRWLYAQASNLKQAIHKLPSAIIHGNFDYCDKLFQWMIPSRALLFGSLIMITFGSMFVSWILAVKWIGLLFILIFVFSLAIPDYLVDAKFVKAFKTLPLLFVLMAANLLRNKKL